MRQEILRLERLSVNKNDNTILKDFHMTLSTGEILGLLIDKTHKKEALIDVLSGKDYDSDFSFYFDDNPILREKICSIWTKKMTLIENEGNLLDDFSIADNVFVFKESFSQHVIPTKILINQADRLLNKFSIEIDSKNYVSKLKVWQKYLVEIVKSYASGKKIVILKDMTSILSTADIRTIGIELKRFCKYGMSFILIDEYPNIFTDITDRVIVVKNGSNIWSFAQNEFSVDVVNLFLKNNIYESKEQEFGKRSKKILEFSNVSGKKFYGLTTTLFAGDIVTLYDEDGNSIEEVVDIALGIEKPSSGKVFYNNKELDKANIKQCVKDGICLVKNKDAKDLLFVDMTGLDNLCFPLYEKIRFLDISPSYKKSVYNTYKNYFSNEILKKYVDELEAYDLIKLVYLKLHLNNPKLVICEKPFSTGDIRLREITYQMLNLLSEKGIAVLIITSNYFESNVLNNNVIKIKSKE